ncbi:MAG: cation diffusion facilitator family transporter [Thermoleophilia bacterium]
MRLKASRFSGRHSFDERTSPPVLVTLWIFYAAYQRLMDPQPVGGALVIATGVVILITGWYPVDALVSCLLGLAILWGAWQIIRETLEIFLKESPRAIDVDDLLESMKRENGVRDIHDIHVWTLGSGIYVSPIPRSKWKRYHVKCRVHIVRPVITMSLPRPWIRKVRRKIIESENK